MHNLRKKKRFTVTMLIVIMTVFMAVPVMAGEADYTIQYSEDNYLYGENNESGYGLVIDDQANLFSDIQEKRIMSYMSDCALGGHIILVTLDVNGYSSAYDFAKAYYRSMIPEESGILYLIDMDYRELRFYSEGSYHNILTSSIQDVIADNVYRMASAGDYYGCVVESFDEVSEVLNGNRIAQPMKYISNACLAVLLALVINYFIARTVSRAARPSDREIMSAINSSILVSDTRAEYTHTTKEYSPVSDSDSGSGSGGGGGGGGSSSGGHGF